MHAGTVAPAFFQWGASQYALATRYPDNARVANPSLGAGFVAAKPGDILTLWGTGFGPTDPAQDPSVLTIGTHNVSLKLTVTVGGTPARIVVAALSPGLAGVYQIAIQLPASLPSGDHCTTQAHSRYKHPSTSKDSNEIDSESIRNWRAISRS